MGEKRGMKALEAWCRRVTDGYRGVKVENMTTSWRNGLAFCALIHHFRPDLIDFDSLDKDDIYRNNELAFRTAEHHLGIPALLDAEDMVEYEVPDRLSMLTYLSQFYQAFAGTQQGSSPARAVAKRPSSSAERVVASESPPSKIPARPTPPVRREPCVKCGLPVFIAERLLVGGHILYHRSCFRCARCQNPLSLANCYETEDGQYCCEACPDEVEAVRPQDSDDQYSAEFESALEAPGTPYQPPKDPLLETPRVSVARSSFMNSLMLADNNDTSSEDSRIPSRASSSRDLSIASLASSNKDLSVASRASSSKDLSVSPHLGIPYDAQGSSESHEPISSNLNTQLCTLSSEVVEAKPKSTDNIKSILTSNNKLSGCSISESSSRLEVVAPHISSSGDIPVGGDVVPVETRSITKRNNSDSQPVTANIITKDEHYDRNKFEDDKRTKDSDDLSTPSPKSLVKMRLKMFEQSDSSVGSVDKAKALKTNSNRRYALYRKDTDEDMDNNLRFTKSENTVENINNNLYSNDVSGMNISDDKLSNLKTNEVSKEVTGENISLKELCLVADDLKTDIVTKEVSKEMVEENMRLKEQCLVKDDLKTDVVAKTEEEINIKEKDEENETVVYDASKTEGEVIIKDKDIEKTDKVPEEDIKVPVIPPQSEEELSHLAVKQKDDTVQTKMILTTDALHIKTVDSEVPSVKIYSEPEKVKDSVAIRDVSVEKLEQKVYPSQRASRTPEEGEYPEELNPFGDDDGEDDAMVTPDPSPNAKSENTNPFGSSDEEEPVIPPVPTTKPPRPPLPTNRLKTLPNPRRVVEAPKVNLNPFWSEGDEPSSDEESALGDGSTEKPPVPVPLPRTIKPSTTPEPSPMPRKHLGLGSTGRFGSATSLSSVSSSTGGTARRKKKPAPPPPSARELFPASEPIVSSGSSRASSPTTSVGHSPQATPRRRKTRPAPPPPSTTTPIPGTPPQPWEQEKLEKDEANRNRQSLTTVSVVSSPTSTPGEQVPSSPVPSHAVPNKCMYGQWKRKKGPAPPRPVPQRRQIKAMPMQEVRRELEDIEVQQQELERQGVALEQTIRDKFEQTPAIDDSSITPDVEDLVLQLFELVNEKNELFRRQAELMYLRRQQRLEEEHADLEYQIRCLLERPESTKTDSDKAREEELIQRLVEVVERRNEIVECLEMDRLREAEEDHSIHTQLGIFAAKTKGIEEKIDEKSKKSVLKSAKKEKKLKKHKEKHGIKKGAQPIIDVDKDIDEMESLSEHTKEKKSKKKWFL